MTLRHEQAFDTVSRKDGMAAGFNMEDAYILLVDDEPPLLRLMGEYLRHLGYHVETCTTGTDGLRALEQRPGGFALVVVDLSLPDFRGDELVRELLTRYPELPILICSGLPYNVESLPPRVRFLQKPFLPKMLAEEIQSMIASRG